MNLSILHKSLLVARKTSPTTLLVAGVVGIVASGILVGRATLKAPPVIEEIKDDLEMAKQFRDDEDEPQFDDKAYARTVIKISWHAAGDFARLYALPVGIAAVSIAAISGGHVILLKRNAALAATLTMTEKAFSSYRKAVADEIGEEAEKAIRYSKTIERLDDTASGTVSEIVKVDPSKHSPYARFFDELNVNWERNADYNKVFLLGQQAAATQRLNAYGYLLLNDVYEALGFEKTSAGAVVGWALGEGRDGFVDFGIYDFTSLAAHEFVNGQERSILLDFNVDGVVYHLISES